MIQRLKITSQTESHTKCISTVKAGLKVVLRGVKVTDGALRSKRKPACYQHHLSLTICLSQPFSRNDSSVSRAATSETPTSAEQSKRIQHRLVIRLPLQKLSPADTAVNIFCPMEPASGRGRKKKKRKRDEMLPTSLFSSRGERKHRVKAFLKRD